MAGLQGSGKTTMTGKLALRLAKTERKKVLVASLDTRRPAAMEQLAILAKQAEVESLPIVPGQAAPDIARRALSAARLGGYDVRHPRHRRAHHARRGDDERGGRDRPHRAARPRPCWWPTA